MRDRSLVDLQRRLGEVLGSEHAMTLMRYLPQEEVATRARVDALENGIDGRLRALEERMDLKLQALEHRLHRKLGKVEERLCRDMWRIENGLRSDLVAQTRTYVFASLGSMTTLAALAFAAARLT